MEELHDQKDNGQLRLGESKPKFLHNSKMFSPTFLEKDCFIMSVQIYSLSSTCSYSKFYCFNVLCLVVCYMLLDLTHTSHF